MKKWLLCATAISMIVLGGCSKKDSDYYLSHIEDAKAKMSECEKSLIAAFGAKDEKKIEKIAADPECQAAENALSEYKDQQRKLAAEKEKAEQEKKITEEEQKINQELGQATWQEVATKFASSECTRGYFSNDDYHCIAFNNIYNQRTKVVIDELSKEPFLELKEKQKEYCARDQRNFSPCAVWLNALNNSAESYFSAMEFPQLDALEKEYGRYTSSPVRSVFSKIDDEKEKHVIDDFVNNYDSLKQTWNQCIANMEKAKTETDGRQKVHSIADNYPCLQVKKARNKLNLPYDDFDTPME